LYLIHALLFRLYNDAASAFAPFFRVDQNLAKCLLRLVIIFVAATAAAYFSRITFEEFFLRLKDKVSEKKVDEESESAEPVLPVRSSVRR
jgi:hypothetical protein